MVDETHHELMISPNASGLAIGVTADLVDILGDSVPKMLLRVAVTALLRVQVRRIGR
jgi:hypothetical protein